MAYEVSGEMITFPNDSAEVSGYLASPGADGKFPGVIVIQEWWGLVPHIKDVAERFAAEGFLAIAPDLYHGQQATEPDRAMQLARSLAWDSALHDLQATAKHFSRLDNFNGKVGCVGFCMGGGLTYRIAAHSDALSAAVIFYGSSPNQLEEAKSVSCPILGLYGETDARITGQVPALEEALKANGVQVETHVYPDAPHAFFNDEAPSYREEAAKDAWQKTLAFFRQHLAQA
jgi:carboxymethylenebutenolidase